MNKNNYKLYKSNTILNNREDLINVCFKTHDKIINNLKVSETTWSYAKYNFFQMSSSNINCYHLFIELKRIIREFVGHTRPLWFQSWLNFHTPNQVLDWHNHNWPFHGYISIDSKKTKTVFEDYEIMNEDGNIYIGLGHKKHKVEVLENYDTPRITIGFDVTEGNVFHMNSFLPID